MNPSQRQRRERAFSLIELAMVLTIIAVIGALAAPRFTEAAARSQLNAAADRVVSDLNAARARARAGSQSVLMSFDTTTNSYSLTTATNLSETVQFGESPYDVKITLAKFGTSTTAHFNGYGVPTSEGVIVLSNGSESATIILGANGEATR